MFQIILLQAAMMLGPILLLILGLVFGAGMLVIVPKVLKKIRKESDSKNSQPDTIPRYRQLLYLVISIVISTCIVVVVCLLVMVGLFWIIGPIM
jgi:hypothetical protein